MDQKKRIRDDFKRNDDYNYESFGSELKALKRQFKLDELCLGKEIDKAMNALKRNIDSVLKELAGRTGNEYKTLMEFSSQLGTDQPKSNGKKV